MTTRPLVLLPLLLAFVTSGRTDAVCTRAEPYVTTVLHGSVVACRSALPEIKAALEPHRESHERWAQPLRDKLPNGGTLFILRPYDEHVSFRLNRVAGVILTFKVDGRALYPTDFDTGSEEPRWQALAQPEQRELYLLRNGSSCERLPDPQPTVVILESVCCDVTPSTDDSCLLGLTPAFVPLEGLLQALRGHA